MTTGLMDCSTKPESRSPWCDITNPHADSVPSLPRVLGAGPQNKCVLANPICVSKSFNLIGLSPSI